MFKKFMTVGDVKMSDDGGFQFFWGRLTVRTVVLAPCEGLNMKAQTAHQREQ